MNRTLRTYLLETKYELVKAWRLPAFAIPTLTFPVIFYVLFGLTFGNPRSSLHMATYLIATYGAFGVMGPALYGFGVGVATERGQGWMLLKRATPMPPLAYFAAKTVAAVLFGGLVFLMMSALGVLFGDVHIRLGQWASLFLVILLGGIPFCAIGLVIGSWAGPNSAPGFVNVLYLPMALLGGLWIPVQMLPKFLQNVAIVLPSYHFGQLATAQIGMSLGGNTLIHAGVLAVYACAGLALARSAYLRDDGRSFG